MRSFRIQQRTDSDHMPIIIEWEKRYQERDTNDGNVILLSNPMDADSTDDSEEYDMVEATRHIDDDDKDYMHFYDDNHIMLILRTMML